MESRVLQEVFLGPLPCRHVAALMYQLMCSCVQSWIGV